MSLTIVILLFLGIHELYWQHNFMKLSTGYQNDSLKYLNTGGGWPPKLSHFIFYSTNFITQGQALHLALSVRNSCPPLLWQTLTQQQVGITWEESRFKYLYVYSACVTGTENNYDWYQQFAHEYTIAYRLWAWLWKWCCKYRYRF